MERAAIELTNMLKEAADKFVLAHNHTPRSKPWWNEERKTKRVLYSALRNWKVVRDEST